jgi:3-phosphoshikimate 1-carboxyvinyltransferase
MKYREIIPLKQRPYFQITLPGSKSITNRVFLCAALAKGKSWIYGALKSEDTDVMLGALRKFQIPISKFQNGISIEGNGGKFKSGNVTIDAGASGTTTRFLTALSVLREGKTIIKGTKRIKERPIKDLDDALAQLKSGKKVIRIKGDKSSQFLSALLMISPYLGPIKIEVVGKLVSKPYIDTTIAVMKAFGVKVGNDNYKSFVIKPQTYKSGTYTVEGDASSASYWTSIAYLHGGKVRFTNLNKKSVQGDIKYVNNLNKLKIKNYGLRIIDMNAMPDVAMTLAVCAPFFKRQTKIIGLSTLRIKETDRLKALENELRKVGVNVKTTKDSITISPIGIPMGAPIGTPIGTYRDHRMAMCFSVLGTMVTGIVIENPDCVNKTYPKFWEDLELAYLSPIKLGQKNLVLTGMRCSGKTCLGKKIARLLKRKFVDLDDEIEKTEKTKIKDIVKRHGWLYFRKIEQKMCSLLAGQKNLIIATGGGVVLNPKNIRALKKNGVNVFIFTNPSVIVERIKRQSKNRPTLTGKGNVKEIQNVWQERRDLYLKYADHIWDDTSGKVVEKNLPFLF